MAGIVESVCPDCGAPVLLVKIEDPLRYMREKKINRDVVLDAELAVPDDCDLYRTYYSSGSGDYTEKLRRENVHRRHSCPE